MSTIEPSTSVSPGTARGCLYLVPNALDLGWPPEGDAMPLSDVLPARVIQTAATLKHWVVENAKSARSFLKRVHAVVPLQLPLQQLDIQELPRAAKGSGAGIPASAWQRLLEPLSRGENVGLISEAGLAAVADPGEALVLAAHAAGLEVQSLAGPSALTLALAASGLNGQSFAFVGYVPVETTARDKRLRELEQLSQRTRQTQLFIEAPYRNPALMDALLSHLRDTTRLSVSCGLTLPCGWSRTMTIAQWRKVAVSLPTNVPAVFALLG